MPRLVHATPKYRLHRASGQAVVSIEGRDFYLGPWKSTASLVEYDRLVAEWLANNRQLPVADDDRENKWPRSSASSSGPWAKSSSP